VTPGDARIAGTTVIYIERFAREMQVWHPECRASGKRACVWVAQW
jgi:hypothetical protein